MRLLRFLPALAVVGALSVLYAVGDSGEQPQRVLGGSRIERAGEVIENSPLPDERPGILGRLPRSEPRARVLPHVAQLLADILTPQEVSLSPVVIASNMAFAGLLTGVLAFADRLIAPVEALFVAAGRRLFGKGVLEPKQRRGGFRKTALLIVALMAVTASLQTFLTSDRGILGSGGVFLFGTILVSAVILSGFAELAKYLLARHRKLEARVELKPTGVLMAGLTVGFSRLANLVPGLLVGQAGGVKYETKGVSSAGWLALAGLLVVGSVAGLAWAASYAIPQSLSGNGGSHAQDFSLGLYFAAVQGVIFGALPVKGAPGHAVWKWNRFVWVVLALPAAFLLFHTVLNPAGSFFDATQSANGPAYIALAGLLCAIPALAAGEGERGRLRELPQAGLPGLG